MMGQAAHLRNCAALPDDCEIVALSEIRPKLGEAVACKFGVPRVYGDFTEMLSREKIDAVVASQPFTRHGILVTELAKAGLPLFTGKSITASVEFGERIVATVAANNTC